MHGYNERSRISSAPSYKSRHLSKFPGRDQPSIFDVKELNYRVRKGNGWDLFANGTDKKTKNRETMKWGGSELF